MADTIDQVLQETETKMNDAVDHFSEESRKIRAGKANPAMLDGVKIDYYGSMTPVTQVATVTAADARTLNVQPYEQQHLQPIEKAILEANLGVTPNNDGKIIRINLPQLTEERRKELVKMASSAAEDSRISVRNARREANDDLKKLQKAGESEDAIKAAEDQVQKLTDKHIQAVDDMLEAKEKEIMTV